MLYHIYARCNFLTINIILLTVVTAILTINGQLMVIAGCFNNKQLSYR